MRFYNKIGNRSRFSFSPIFFWNIPRHICKKNGNNFAAFKMQKCGEVKIKVICRILRSTKLGWMKLRPLLVPLLSSKLHVILLVFFFVVLFLVKECLVIIGSFTTCTWLFFSMLYYKYISSICPYIFYFCIMAFVCIILGVLFVIWDIYSCIY